MAEKVPTKMEILPDSVETETETQMENTASAAPAKGKRGRKRKYTAEPEETAAKESTPVEEKAVQRPAHKSAAKAKKHAAEPSEDDEAPKAKKKEEESDPWKAVAIFLVLVLVAGAIVYMRQGTSPANTIIPTTTIPAVPATTPTPSTGTSTAGSAPVLGNANAPVTIVIFTDFQCPYCGAFETQTFPSIKTNYIDTGKVKLEFHNFPLSFHQYAQKAAEAAECAKEQGKFWEYHDKLFTNQNALDTTSLKKYAADVGLDTAKFNSCLDTGKYASAVQADVAAGTQAGVSGTPSFLVNGELVVGAQPYTAFQTVINKKLGVQDNGTTTTTNDPPIDFIIVTDSNCTTCDPSQVISVTRQQIFPTINVRQVEWNSAEGQALIQKYNINAIPTYIFGPNVTKAANYAQVASALDQIAGSYLIKAGAAGGAGRYLHPPTAGNSPVLGSPTAKVTIIEFSDFQCPYCGKFFTDTYPSIKKDYVDTGKVKIAFKNLPLTSLHANAEKAAEASECANEQGKFWEYHDKLFANQNALDIASLKKYATDLGLDAAKFNDCLDTAKYASTVQKDTADAEAVGVSGTPSFFVGDTALSGAQPYANFKQVIDEQLAKAT
ncbi:Thioredoxin [uncultured archaeon]|nr:Thioredoxin [uncultured archaeon]